MTALAEQAVDAINATYGRHPAQRAAHAKGLICRGVFAATPEAARITTALHMQGEPVEATVRFSHASGDPSAHDAQRDARGMATKLYLPDGSRTDIVAVTLPCFMTRTPAEFVDFARARRGDGPARAARLLKFMATHPESWRAIRAVATMKGIASYASCRYNALHSFRWLAPDGRKRHIRYSWVPEAGEQAIARRATRRRGPDYLRDELLDRLGREPVRFRLELELARAGDLVDDPTAVWPAGRRRLVVGTLELTGPDTERERGDDVLVFDPTRVTDGIELSDDPILRFRPEAYAVSVERRARPGSRAPEGVR